MVRLHLIRKKRP